MSTVTIKWTAFYTKCPLGAQCGRQLKCLKKCWSKDQAINFVLNHLTTSSYHKCTEEEAQKLLDEDFDHCIDGPYEEDWPAEDALPLQKRARTDAVEPKPPSKPPPPAPVAKVAKVTVGSSSKAPPSAPIGAPASSSKSAIPAAAAEDALSKIQQEYDWQAQDRIKAAYSFCKVHAVSEKL